MSTSRLQLEVAGETNCFPSRAPFFPRARGTARFPAPLPAHVQESRT